MEVPVPSTPLTEKFGELQRSHGEVVATLIELKASVKAIVEKLRTVIKKLDKKRSRKFKYDNELRSFKEGLSSIFWVVSPKPG